MRSELEFDFEFVVNEIKNIPNPVVDNSQIECFNYIARYVIFSYLKQSKQC